MSGRKLPDINYLRARAEKALSGLGSVDDETAGIMRSSNTQGWIWSMLSVSGSSLTKESVGNMLSGGCALEATLEESRLADACRVLRTEFDILSDMNTYPDSEVIRRFHSIIAGPGADSDYRKGTPRIKDMDYTPPHGSEIPSRMRTMEIAIASSEEDALSSAVRMHDMIMEIWPFDEYNEATAYAVMSYMLLIAGYPLPTISMTAYEHRRLTAEFIHAGTSGGITSMLLINIISECRIPDKSHS